MKKTINIHDKATINGIGTHTATNAKPVVCIDNGEVFTSMLDAAEYAGVANPSMVVHLQGKTRTCGGKRFCYLSKATDNLDSIVTRLREASTDAEDAKKWREYKAEQEAIRIAEEKRQAEIANLKAKLARQNEICKRIGADLLRATASMMETENKLNAINGVE